MCKCSLSNWQTVIPFGPERENPFVGWNSPYTLADPPHHSPEHRVLYTNGVLRSIIEQQIRFLYGSARCPHSPLGLVMFPNKPGTYRKYIRTHIPVCSAFWRTPPCSTHLEPEHVYDAKTFYTTPTSQKSLVQLGFRKVPAAPTRDTRVGRNYVSHDFQIWRSNQPHSHEQRGDVGRGHVRYTGWSGEVLWNQNHEQIMPKKYIILEICLKSISFVFFLRIRVANHL